MTATIHDIADAMKRHGMAPVNPGDIRTDGVICRFDSECDKRGRRNGWAVCFLDGPRAVCTFGHWSKGIHVTEVIGQQGPMNAAEREKARIAIECAKRTREADLAQRRNTAKREAGIKWREGRPVSEHHPYLLKKGIDSTGLRERFGLLLVPMRTDTGELVNLQTIRADGQKRFLRGGLVTGAYACIGGTVGDHLLICEGWATGKSLHAATGLPVACAMSAGNLRAVAESFRRRYPHIRLTIACDNDPKPDGTNPGVDAGRAAAAAVGGFVAIPEQPGDFNDAAQSSPSAISEKLA
jgi:putative DNA primase/helicase